MRELVSGDDAWQKRSVSSGCQGAFSQVIVVACVCDIRTSHRNHLCDSDEMDISETRFWAHYGRDSRSHRLHMLCGDDRPLAVFHSVRGDDFSCRTANDVASGQKSASCIMPGGFGGIAVQSNVVDSYGISVLVSRGDGAYM